MARLQVAEFQAAERDALQACLNHEETYADGTLPRLRLLAKRLEYIATEYDCTCETPGVTNDCPVCTARAALVSGAGREPT